MLPSGEKGYDGNFPGDPLHRAGAPLIACLDVGTTFAKAGLVSPDGTLLKSIRRRLGLMTDESGKAEHDVRTLQETTLSMLEEVVDGFQDRVVGIVLSTYLLGLMATNRAFEPVSNMVTLADTRAKEAAERLFSERLDPEEVYKRTGFPPTFHSPLVKLHWLAEKLKGEFGVRELRFLSAKDLVLLTLTGEPYTDVSTASATSMLNVRTLKWDEELLATVGAETDQLSQILPVESKLQILPSLAKRCRLRESTPVVVGSYDGGAVGLSAGALVRPVCAVNLGTTSMARVASDGPVISGNAVLKVQNVALVGGKWFPGSSVNNAGILVEWLWNAFGMAPSDYSDETLLDGYVDRHLLVFPYVTGERGFSFGSNAFGTIMGLEIKHRKEHVYVASLEGVCFSLKLGMDLLSENGVRFDRIVVSGSGATSKLWLTILANVTGKVVEVDTSAEPGLIGSAMLGFHVTGYFSSLQESATRLMSKGRLEVIPRDSLLGFYEEKYGKFRKELLKIYTL